MIHELEIFFLLLEIHNRIISDVGALLNVLDQFKEYLFLRLELNMGRIYV